MQIAVLDSGVGGLSVLRHLRGGVGGHDVVYAADEAWCPYGLKPPDLVRGRVLAVVDALVGRGAGMVVVACNTASTVALADLRRRHPGVPFVGMEPAVKPAAALTRSGVVGVLATAATAAGEPLARLVDRFGRGVDVRVAVPAGLVELVERGEGDGPAAEALLRPILAGWRAAGVDAVVLGCTHYPFARAAVERLAGPGVAVVDPAPAVARQALRLLGELGELDAADPGDPELGRPGSAPPDAAASTTAGARAAPTGAGPTPRATSPLGPTEPLTSAFLDHAADADRASRSVGRAAPPLAGAHSSDDAGPAPSAAGHAAPAAAPTPAGATIFLTTGDPAALRALAPRLVPERWVAAAAYARLDL